MPPFRMGSLGILDPLVLANKTSFHHVSMVGDGCGWITRGYYDRDRRDLGATVVFKIPIYRELMLWSGCVDAGTQLIRDYPVATLTWVRKEHGVVCTEVWPFCLRAARRRNGADANY